MPLVGFEPTIFGLKVRCPDQTGLQGHSYYTLFLLFLQVFFNQNLHILIQTLVGARANLLEPNSNFIYITATVRPSATHHLATSRSPYHFRRILQKQDYTTPSTLQNPQTLPDHRLVVA